MYSPSRKVRASVQRTILLITISCLTSLLLIENVLSSKNFSTINYPPTESAGRMLNRSQILLSKNVTLQPWAFMCLTNRTEKSPLPTYPMIIVVKTRAVSSGPLFERRIFTRTSWGHDARALGIPVIYAVGRSIDDQTQTMLEYENKLYGDLLQFNYIDFYYNITIKTSGILNWFAKHGCDRLSRYVFVVDDDVLLNLPLLLKKISLGQFEREGIYGLYLQDIEPHPSGKWAVSLKDFPNRTYPTFIIGAATFYSSAVIRPIVEELDRMIDRNESIFFLDDVLFSGIIAEKLAIPRAPMSGIEVCSETDLVSRTVISECNPIRRVYVWSKYLLQRNGIDSYAIDRLIETTTYLKWEGNFKQTRNGTAILPQRIILFSSSSILLPIFALILLLLFILIFLPKVVFSSRQTSPGTAPQAILTKKPSSMLLTPVK